MEDFNCRIRRTKYDRAGVYLRNYLYGKDKRWPKGLVEYVLPTDMRYRDTKIIREAMDQIEKNSCVQFVRLEEGGRNSLYIFTHFQECSASLGYQPGGVALNLGSSCMSTGIIIHELLHVLGTDHEHNRPDRDCHINVIWENIQPDHTHNFLKNKYAGGKSIPCHVRNSYCGNCFSNYYVDTFGMDYDQNSIMHYGHRHFTKYRGDTIVPKDGGYVGSHGKLTELDVKKLKVAYGTCT